MLLLLFHLLDLPIQIKPESFAAVREQLLRRYQNALLSPSKAAGALRLQFLSGGPHWTHDQLAAALQDIQQVEAVQVGCAGCCPAPGG